VEGQGFELFPTQASTVAPQVDGLFLFILAVSLFFTALVAGLLTYFAIRYRRRSEAYFPTPIVGSTLLESLWTVIPLGIALVMFFWAVSVYFKIIAPPGNATEVYVVGKQWMWHLQHGTGQSEINQLHVPAGEPIKLVMTTEDVIHDFSIPAFRVKQDVIPGRYTQLWFNATRPGRYHLFCAAYCGTEHSRMIGTVTVMEKAEFDEWLRGTSPQDGTTPADRSLATEGQKLFRKLQCITCHTGNAEARAPTLEDLYMKPVQLDNDEQVVADETYIRESILKPQAKVVRGWKPIMPTFQGQVTEEDLIKVIAYIKSLKRGDTPPRIDTSAPPEANDKTKAGEPSGGGKKS
jgi:cytochrome c oxidase subunit 2